MSVHVLFFGVIAAKLGVRECTVPLDQAATLAELIQATGCEGMAPILLAVNQQLIDDWQTALTAGDEVAIMPPFSGG